MTPALYTRVGGALVPIPAEHARVLMQYRDSMPLVAEPQYHGDQTLYPLIDHDEEPYGTPRPSTLEELARTAAARLRDARLDTGAPLPELGTLARAAIRAHLADLHQFATAVHHDDPAAARTEAGKAVATAADTLTRHTARTAREITARTADRTAA